MRIVDMQTALSHEKVIPSSWPRTSAAALARTFGDWSYVGIRAILWNRGHDPIHDRHSEASCSLLALLMRVTLLASARYRPDLNSANTLERCYCLLLGNSKTKVTAIGQART